MIDVQALESQGPRPAMEDAHCIESLAADETLVGIFDGHGDQGKVAQMAANSLRRLFEAAGGDAVERLGQVFAQIHANVGLLNLSGGCCALAFHLKQSSLTVASLGDAGLAWIPAGESRGLPLSSMHRLDNPGELMRVYQAGAVLRRPYWMLPTTGQGLMPTRTIGDLALDGPWLSREPYRATAELEGEGYLVAACDGLWDVLNPDQVAVLLNDGGSLVEQTERLGAAMLGHPSASDNLTLIVLHYLPEVRQTEDEDDVLGSSNLIPLPMAQDQHKVLDGDGALG